ncbi:hypothetical protein THAOC_34968 [Thalassiosira oceanica]|uniref:Uncharacterized protein n=1 Tax=Thalassiosira oceanica TaxID=159749 RepID=K0R427_THAOC|nr:hypothetical protein THAOC_34968 [Thalassiosira oceanica]|eukprot:EJK46364.1 hypothetical protein THAOC_34968 [Thalassiosira oceanica]
MELLPSLLPPFCLYKASKEQAGASGHHRECWPSKKSTSTARVGVFLSLACSGKERSRTPRGGQRVGRVDSPGCLPLALPATYCSRGVPVQRRPSAPSDSPMSGPEPTPFPGILHLVLQNWPPKDTDGRGGITSGRGNAGHAGEQDEGGDRLDTGWVASVGDGETKWLVQPTVARKTTTKCVTNGQHRNQTKEEPGTKWVVHPSLNRSSKEGRPASGTDLAIEKKSPGIGAQTGNGRQQKAPPRSHDENGTNCLVRHPSPPQSRGDDAVAWSQLVDFEQPNNSTSFALSDFQCGPEANALPDVESLFPSKSDQKSKQFDECEPSRDSPLVPHTSHHSKTEATKNPNKRSQHGKDYKHKVGENPRGSPPDWKKSIPEESVDPISLEPLCELEYPPFAIVADGLPYTPVFPGDWPPADPADETSEEEGRELAILRSQWGEALPKFKSEESGDYKPLTERRFNLFDGQILAFYLVSTLQFIDPYNRRDLTREELRALDAYLSRHGLKRAGVVEAYDQKGENRIETVITNAVLIGC